MNPLPERVDVLGVGISAVSIAGALDTIDRRIENGGGGYVCLTNVHAVVTARTDAQFREVTNNSFLSLADGKPVFWFARWRGNRRIGHTPGPDLMRRAVRQFPHRRHFLYGSTPAVLDQLRARLQMEFPDLQVCGSLSPPFGPVSEGERQEHCRLIRESGAQLVWVGLGAPRQEKWMATNAPELAPAILLGVGAAFDFHAGAVVRAPRFMQHVGLEWFYRLLREPRRLWRRYLITNSLFVLYVAKDAIRRTFGPR